MSDRIKKFLRRIPGLEKTARAVYDLGIVRLLLDRRHQLARKHLSGLGLEIGALHRPLYLPSSAKAFYLDRNVPADLRSYYPELNGLRLYVSLVDDGEKLLSIADCSLDFVVANHMIEHCEDPIQTLETFASKLKNRGILFMAVPDKERTFDSDRDETPWTHHLKDHTEGAGVSRASHYLEWAAKVEHLAGPEAEQRALELMDARYSIHFHCWTLKGFMELLDKSREFVPFALVEYRSWKDENIFILRKQQVQDGLGA